jgi:hypothetical protein
MGLLAIARVGLQGMDQIIRTQGLSGATLSHHLEERSSKLVMQIIGKKLILTWVLALSQYPPLGQIQKRHGK